ncbi:MAG TPA: hypothetical protein VKA74_13740 [Myxococcota bacterium]|nr:hypothetical protein [Myxococcota bacterium]
MSGRRESKKGGRRRISWTLVGALVTLVAASAFADRPPTRGDRGGIAVVEETNLVRKTISLMGSSYLVTASSKLVDENGNEIGLGQLRARNGGARSAADQVRYSLRRVPGALMAEIVTLQVVAGAHE